MKKRLLRQSFFYVDALKFKEKFEEAGKENKNLAVESKSASWHLVIIHKTILNGTFKKLKEELKCSNEFR